MGQEYPRNRRITRRLDLLRVLREGLRTRTTRLDVRVAASPFGFMRVGVIVPRYGETAVKRNRLKRRLKELMRLHLLSAPMSYDVVVKTRPAAYSSSFAELWEEINAVRKALGETEALRPG